MLGGHASLTVFVGVVTQSLPMCLITHFHGLKEEVQLFIKQPA